ncbi:hypothetical protein PDQ70_16455 [Bacillus cereus group sp. Bc011]|uniref:hypothetical protein n=1 Tax=unclassified Bacillus cereus group TaxID=2750818 RepID=UPI0022DFF9E7|nr:MULTISPECIES: hypothetical protein [unclassified Bacillus cereus group]MDA2681052.1 hypothetical protein [Bacillus cereus group sp. Bc029]MDA2742050.1 hypothetical protein [Bacillus cereus group sp. Bc011]
MSNYPRFNGLGVNDVELYAFLYPDKSVEFEIINDNVDFCEHVLFDKETALAFANRIISLYKEDSHS